MAEARRFGISPTHAEEQVQKLIEAFPNEAFAPLPAPTGTAPYRLPLASVGVTDPTDVLTFLCIGDSGGIKDPNPQNAVAAALVADAAKAIPNLLYHVGDVVYFNGDASEFYPQFYEPYDHLNVPIFAIPGNHDGDNSDDTSVPSLSAFVENFCAAKAQLTTEAKDSNRDAMTQPNVYWTLNAALATIIGLYSNVPSGGEIKQDQIDWFVGELQAAPSDRALLVALHHPPMSADAHHGGSKKMGDLLDAAFGQASRWPDMVLTGHVHDYQRFTREVDGRQIPYIVNGAGGYHNLHGMAKDASGAALKTPWQVPGITGVTLEAYEDAAYGFLRFEITRKKIIGTYVAVAKADGSASEADSFTIDLAAHAVA